MILTDEQIKEYIENPRAKEFLSNARDTQEKHKLHVLGEGFHSWLEDQAKGIESVKTLERKKRLCTPKTVSVTEQIKKQFMKAFRAKGNVFNYHFKDTAKGKEIEFALYLKQFSNGMSMEEIMQKKWFEAMFQDFNGFLAVELKPVNELLDPTKEEPYICLYSTNQTHDVHIVGIRVEYIILKWEIVIANEKKEAYRVIDDAKDVIYYKEGAGIVQAMRTNEDGEIVPDVYETKFRQVPFVQVSNYQYSPSDSMLKNSTISKVIGDLDDLLGVATDHTICIKLHQRPIFYSLPTMCTTCNGSGEVMVKGEHGKDTTGTCGTCNGQKMISPLKTDVAQGYAIPYIESNDGGFPGAQAPCGYVTPDNESLREQRVELESIRRTVERGALGSDGLLTLDEAPRQETATRAELNLQPLMDTLEPFSQNASVVRQFLTDRVGEVVYGEQFERSYIYYGRKYFLRSENQILAELEMAKKAGASKSFIKELMSELYWIQFEGNPQARDRSILLLDLEPFPEVGSSEELALLQPFADPVMLIVKANFNDFIERFEEENGSIVGYNMEAEYRDKIKEIKSILYTYGKEAKLLIGESQRENEPKENGSST
jgi:hypothetical protein